MGCPEKGSYNYGKRNLVAQQDNPEKLEEPEEYDVEDNPPKPPPSFNGMLSKFIFSATKPSHIRSYTPKLFLQPLQQKKNEPSSRATNPKKKRRKHTGYAPPSTYAHLTGIPDALGQDLICVFIGFNPGIASATSGHAFASPTNLFWSLLHSSGCTPDQRLPPSMDEDLPALYSLGHTNLVSRPSRDAAELSKEEMIAAVPQLEGKLRAWRPESVCLVGKAIWEAIWKNKKGKGLRKEEFKWGWQEMRLADEKGWDGCRVFVVPSTSGLVAAYSPEFKRAIWRELGDWVQDRRQKRGETAPKVIEGM